MRTVVTTVTITDDLGGQGEAATFKFTHNGRDYEIDLNKRNTDTFQRRIEALYAPYIAVSRDVTRDATDRNKRIREWAAGEGIDVASRGAIPRDVISAYDAAHTEP